MNNKLILLLVMISVTQLVVVTILTELISGVTPEFDPVTMFAGNLQIILIIIGYKLFTKYVRIS